MKAIIGTLFKNKEQATKSAKEKIRITKTEYVILCCGDNFLVVNKKYLE